MRAHGVTRGFRFFLRRRFFVLASVVFALGAGLLSVRPKPARQPDTVSLASLVPVSAVSMTLADSIERNDFPSQLVVRHLGQEQTVQLGYTIDWAVQAYVQGIWKQYRPDYAAFAAIEPSTGRIVALSSFTREENELGNLALRSIFPAASVFKIITAAAAMEVSSIQPDTKIPYVGRDHTLYRRQVFPKNPSLGREMTLKDAFARSVNTVFARVGLDWVGADQLQVYARRFRFREPFVTDVPIGMGTISVGPDPWDLAEIASGFNRVVRLSPLHGAAIASALVNEGTMMEPFLIDSMTFGGDGSYHTVTPRVLGRAVSPRTASAMREMMEETVRSGTPSRAFRSFRRQLFPLYSVGGKTGSLSSQVPQGKCDWFVGYVTSPHRSLAYAILTVNQDKWRVKSATVAEMIVKRFFHGRDGRGDVLGDRRSRIATEKSPR